MRESRAVAPPPSHRRRLLAGLLACLPLAAFGGCGNSRTPVQDYSKPLPPNGFQPLSYPAAGLYLSAPRNWIVSRSKLPLVATVSSGSAIVALWRFPRKAPAPVDHSQLAAARQTLLKLSRQRDPELQVIRTALGSLHGAPVVEVDTFQKIAGQQRRVRSLHVFVPGSEVVLEQYAPPPLFHAVDHVAFSPIKRSLRIRTPS
jgi:hypothetical protein